MISASAKESESAEMKKRKLESLQFQNEVIFICLLQTYDMSHFGRILIGL